MMLTSKIVPGRPPDRPRSSRALPLAADAAENPHVVAALPTWTLRYEDRWFGIEKRLDFQAADAAAALAIADREPIGRWAELSQGGAVMCRLGGEPDGLAEYWTVD